MCLSFDTAPLKKIIRTLINKRKKILHPAPVLHGRLAILFIHRDDDRPLRR